jgi:NAD(P)-dependent dehydrogenase (short-subunit alcohol dehydrogenase family)
MKGFSGKTAVITGGASGIGLALANAAADRQMNVVLADIEENALQAAVEHLEKRQTPVLGILTDVSQKPALEKLYYTYPSQLHCHLFQLQHLYRQLHFDIQM